MKIAVPWPAKLTSQPRIRESLDLWENKQILFLCLAIPCDDPYLKDFQFAITPRNSQDIGTRVPKCYIYDMIKLIRDQFPNEDWYGFGNSDCVPVGDIIEGHTDYEILIYHRTEVKEWQYRFVQPYDKPMIRKLGEKIWALRQEGMTDKRIARLLNHENVPVPSGHTEWTYDLIRNLYQDQGTIFFWGQDMYLFRADVVDRILEEYLKVKDPILGTGGFDPRLTKWCLDNFRAARVLNKIFHKEHTSEWNVDEVEYLHNGGDIPLEERPIYYTQTFLQSLCDQGQKGAIPRYIRYLVGRKDPVLLKDLFTE